MRRLTARSPDERHRKLRDILNHGPVRTGVNTNVGNFSERAVEVFAVQESDRNKMLTIVLLRDFEVLDQRARS